MDSVPVKVAKGLVHAPMNMVLRKFERLTPRWLVFPVTELCNSRCTYCNIWMNKQKEPPLSPDEVRRIFSDPVFKHLQYISNTGGECTVRTDLKELMVAEHETLPNATLSVSTNSLFPQRAYDAVKYLLEQGANMQVGISLDGIGAEHDRLRGVQGNFEKADWLLTQLAELRKEFPGKLWLAIGSLLMDNSEERMKQIMAYAREKNIHNEWQWYNSSSYYNNGTEDKESQKQKMIDAVKSLPPSRLNEQWVRWLNGESIRFTCFAMHSFCIMKANGDISTCLSHWDATAGNVRQNTPSEVWHGKKMSEIRRTVVDPCKGCLNSWGTNWSWNMSFGPFLMYYLTHPFDLKYRDPSNE